MPDTVYVRCPKCGSDIMYYAKEITVYRLNAVREDTGEIVDDEFCDSTEFNRERLFCRNKECGQTWPETTDLIAHIKAAEEQIRIAAPDLLRAAEQHIKDLDTFSSEKHAAYCGCGSCMLRRAIKTAKGNN